MNSMQNRLLAAPIAALLGPLIEKKLGIQLTDEQLLGLVSCAPIVYHAIASLGQQAAAAFIMYFPPKQQPVKPAGEAK